MIRFSLTNALERSVVGGIGLWSGDLLSALAVWRPDDNDERVLRSSIIAVAFGFRRQGLAERLKRRVLEVAAHNGATVVLSEVHWDNEPMLDLNIKLGGSIRRKPGDADYCECVIPVEPGLR